jgi:putative oxidoreductase
MHTALLIARLVIGLGLAAHGVQKLFGWYGGYGLKGTGEFMVKLGFPSGRLFAGLAGFGETGAGVLLALGLFTPFAAALMILVMLTAILTVHINNGFFATGNGVEMPALYAMSALILAFVGPGNFSLDNALNLTPRYNEGATWLWIGLAVVGAFANYAVSKLYHKPAGVPAARST